MRRHVKNGFTLLEVLLYVAITATLLGGLVIFMALLTQARVKDQTIAEVTGSGTQLLQYITQAVHNAAAVSVVNPSALSITDATGNQSAVVLTDGAVQLQTNQTSVALTSNHVVVDKLIFTSINGAPASVRIEMTLESYNPSGRGESFFIQTWYATATLRP